MRLLSGNNWGTGVAVEGFEANSDMKMEALTTYMAKDKAVRKVFAAQSRKPLAVVNVTVM